MLATWSKMTLYPLKTAHLRAQSTQSRALSWSCSKHSHGPEGVLHWSNAAQMAWMTAYARAFQTSSWGRSTRRPALSEPIKLPSEARIQRWALVSCLGRLWRPASHPTSPFFCGNCAHFIKYALASVQMREMAPSAAGSAPGGCPANALAQAVARSAQAPPSRCRWSQSAQW